MRRLPAALIVGATVVMGMAGPAYAASDAVDQSQTNYSSQLPDGVYSGAMDAQTFVPGTTGSLDRVFVYVQGDGADQLTISVQSTQSTSNFAGTFQTPTGTSLASVAVTPPSTAGWVEADFSSPASVNKGTTYAIVLSATSGYFPVYGDSGTSSYPDGQALHYSGQWYPPGAGYELAFKTYMETTPVGTVTNLLDQVFQALPVQL